MGCVLHNTINNVEGLFERMGGEEAVESTVILFYGKVMKDDRIRWMFLNTSWEVQRTH